MRLERFIYLNLLAVHIYFVYNIILLNRRKVQEDSTCIIKARLVERKDRKLLMTATMEDRHGVILAESTSLFIIVKDADQPLKQKAEY